MTRKRVWSCRGKVRFRDHAEAVRGLHLIRSQGEQRDKTPCRAYECPGCGGWHLTSRPTWTDRAA